MRYAIAIAVAALIICLQWRLVFSDEYTWLDAPGVWDHHLPLLQYQAGEVHKYRLPLWDPYTDGGQPLLGWPTPSPVYPPHLLMLAMPLKQGWLQMWVLHLWYLAIQVAISRFSSIVVRMSVTFAL